MGAVYSRMAQFKWVDNGSITTVGSALTTDKSATTTHALTATTFVRVQPLDGTVAINIRFRGVMSDGHSNVLVLYAMRGSDHYTRLGTLTLITGTQVYETGNLFVDTITIADEKWTDTIEVINDANNGIAYIALNTHGYSDFLLLGTTVNSTSVIVEVAKE